MGWNDDVLLLVLVFYCVWLLSGVSLVALLRVGSGRKVEALAWALILVQLFAAVRGLQVGFVILTWVSLVFVVCGVRALHRLRADGSPSARSED